MACDPREGPFFRRHFIKTTTFNELTPDLSSLLGAVVFMNFGVLVVVIILEEVLLDVDFLLLFFVFRQGH